MSHVSTINPPPSLSPRPSFEWLFSPIGKLQPNCTSFFIDSGRGKNSGQLIPAKKLSSLTVYLFWDDEYKK